MMVTNEVKKQRGLRIREIRKNMLCMSRRAFSEKHHISYPTMQNWEDGRFGGLSKRGAKILASIFNEEGIFCTPQWLLDGEGSMPAPIPRMKLEIREPQLNGYNVIQKELQLFYEHHLRAAHAMMPDDAMEPRFCKGEYVAGIQYGIDELENLVRKDCIFQLKTGQAIIRHLAEIKDENYIVAMDLKSRHVLEIRIRDLLYVALILWARREV